MVKCNENCEVVIGELVASHEHEHEHDTMLGFDSQSGRFMISVKPEQGREAGILYPGEMVQVTARPYVPFVPEWFWVQASSAPNFLIHDLRIGNCSRIATASAPIIAEAFATQLDMLPLITATLESEGGVVIQLDKVSPLLRGRLRLPRVEVAMDVSMTLEHIGKGPARFLAMMVGRSPR